ncbi:MAG: hypothetical protein WC748_03170 [Legionellales bacterium]|jgi:hypothetical protein
MSYTIKSLQKSLTLLQDEFQDLGHTGHSKNHIQDMYVQFQDLADRVSREQVRVRNCRTELPLE